MQTTPFTTKSLTMNTVELVPAQTTPITEVAQPTVIRKTELAKRLSVSKRTIDNWMAKRLIPYIQVSPRFYLYEFEAVLAALKKHYGIEPLQRD